MKLHKVKVSSWNREDRFCGHVLNEVITAYNNALKAPDKDAALAKVRQGIIDASVRIWCEDEVQGIVKVQPA